LYRPDSTPKTPHKSDQKARRKSNARSLLAGIIIGGGDIYQCWYKNILINNEELQKNSGPQSASPQNYILEHLKLIKTKAA
jgi:hypothetical protein